MKTKNALCLLLLMTVAGGAWAYGGSSNSSVRACTKPKFSEFTPADKSEVAANSSFSFMASAQTNPDSISVTIKEQHVAISITPKNQAGFEVTGTIPETVKSSFARININAEGPNGCKGSNGWLLKVAP
jgi:hypothetical protein